MPAAPPQLTALAPAPAAALADELRQAQRVALRTALLLGALLVLGFVFVDAAAVPAHRGEMLVVRTVCAALLGVLAWLLHRERIGAHVAAALGFAAIALPLSLGALWSDEARGSFLYALLMPIAALGLLVPLRLRALALLWVELVAIAAGPLVAQGGPRLGHDLAGPLSVYVALGLLVGAAARVQGQLRMREYLARQEIARQSGLAALGQLSGALAHELGNPLAALLVQLESLERRGALGEPEKKRVASAVATARRMRDTLHAMRRGAQQGTGERSAIDLVQECESALTLVSAAARTTVSFVRELSPVPPVVGQRALVGQVLVNLLLNASEALEGRPGARVTVRLRADAGQVLLEVEDNGPGVPPALRERIFEPFFTTKGERGNGLGLWISADIARAHGGALAVHDAPEGGALFRLTLPAALEAPAA